MPPSSGRRSSTSRISSGSGSSAVARPLPWHFPYVVERNSEDHPLGRTVLRPLVPVRVVGPGGVSTRYEALIDSGSDYSLAAPVVAMEAGVDVRRGRETRLRIGGGLRDVDVCDVELRLCDPGLADADGGCEASNSITWPAEVGFFRSWEDPPFLIILGQVGFFNQFTILMSRLTQGIIVEERDHLDSLATFIGSSPDVPPRRRV